MIFSKFDVNCSVSAICLITVFFVKFEISVNALYDYKKPMGRIMSNGWRHVRIPTEEELIREGVMHHEL